MIINKPWMRLVVIFAFSNLMASFASSEEISLGNTKAPVTLIEYGSLTCGNCIKFHRFVLPRIKNRYIDSGTVRFIYRHFPTSESAVQGALAAQCAGDSYYEMLDELYSTVPSWSQEENRGNIFVQKAISLGLDSEAYSSCFEATNSLSEVVDQQRAARKDYDVTGTPTFIINGKVVRGIKTYVEMETLISEALNKGH